MTTKRRPGWRMRLPQGLREKTVKIGEETTVTIRREDGRMYLVIQAPRRLAIRKIPLQLESDAG